MKSPSKQLLKDALGKVESKSIREWATSKSNAPIWAKIAQGSYVKNGDGPEAVLKLASYITVVAIGA